MQSKNLNKFFYFFIYFISILSLTEVIHNKNLAYCSHIILASLAGDEEQGMANSTLGTTNPFYHIILENPLGGQGQGITDSNPTPELEEKIRNASQYAPYISDFLEENAGFIILNLFFHFKRQKFYWNESRLTIINTHVEYFANILFVYTFFHIAEKIPKYVVTLLTTNNIVENVISEIFFTLKALLASEGYRMIYCFSDTIDILHARFSPFYSFFFSLYGVRVLAKGIGISTSQLFYIIIDVSSKITNKTTPLFQNAYNNTYEFIVYAYPIVADTTALISQNTYNNTYEFIAYYYHTGANTTALISQNVYILFSHLKDCIHDFSENYEYFYYKSLPYAVPFIIYLAAKKYNALLLQIQNPSPIITTPQPAEL